MNRCVVTCIYCSCNATMVIFTDSDSNSFKLRFKDLGFSNIKVGDKFFYKWDGSDYTVYDNVVTGKLESISLDCGEVSFKVKGKWYNDIQKLSGATIGVGDEVSLSISYDVIELVS